MATERLLTLREASERSGHREATWRSWILHRRFPYYKIGKSIRILESDLQRLIEQARVPAREPRHD